MEGRTGGLVAAPEIGIDKCERWIGVGDVGVHEFEGS
jgi:hypothetical protein